MKPVKYARMVFRSIADPEYCAWSGNARQYPRPRLADPGPGDRQEAAHRHLRIKDWAWGGLHSGMTTSRMAMPAFLLRVLLAPGTQAVAQTFTFERSFPATASTLLDVTTERGKITVRAGTAARSGPMRS